ncbi:DNA cytosine methyltransferase [Streptomyces sp. 8K308]|uniref:DNA (cytosine-5-)-methyltransferase n=1 Tax=Streptomyces sp. 8K308 TaxID=2530388 RepID=UPI0010531D5F|nr:DNA (cytosine-5-)-methyltransferase [Streptomyces sp. 8K308]TDC21252.1 DNA cytosine methyltransferase [Streptomyces sp. 8K308]
MTGLRIGSMCSGYGGLDMAVTEVFGGEVVWVADPDRGAAAILAHHWPEVRNLGDITCVDWTKVPPVDVVVGGYPCQPFSDAGLRKGTADDRHIWPHIATALGVLRPRYAVFENVAGHLRRGFDVVLSDLARLGFDAEWLCLRASDIDAPHHRRRLFILAHAADTGGEGLALGPVQPDRHELPPAERGRRDDAPADAPCDGRHEGRPEPARQLGGSDAALRGGAAATYADRDGREGQQRSEPGLEARRNADGRGPERWGRYGPAVSRWEAATGRRAPWATDDRGRLDPAFVEWMMGLPSGWVTDVPSLSRAQQLRALGNGVVPRQAVAAITHLLDRAIRRETDKEAA